MEWAQIAQSLGTGLAALNLDLSPATLTKYAVLLVAIVALLWVIGDVYRGEIQNRDMAVDVIANQRPGYGDSDVLFTRRTFDTRAERLPAKIIVEHRFLIVHGDRQFSMRARVLRRSFKLSAQARQTHSLRHGQFAFAADVEKSIKNRAEFLVRENLRRYRNRPSNILARVLFKNRWTEPDAIGATYLARIHFPSNPLFLLFQHPDREVKATGWLTLLTSIFALLGQFLFAEPNNSPEPRPQRTQTRSMP